jgi:hypothetical protein
MSELIKQFIKAKPFLKTKRYLEANDWSNHVPEFDDEDGKRSIITKRI